MNYMIEEKAIAYDKAYKTAENTHRFSSDPAEIKRMEEIFPELKEGEDERIRKALITFFQKFPYNSIGDAGTNAREAIAWLEKQGENSVCKVKIGETYKCIASPRYTCFRMGDIYHVKDNFIAELINTCSGCFVLLEKQGEQNSVDNIESKFKVGDWVVNNIGEPQLYQVISYSWPDSIIKRAANNLEMFINKATLNKRYHLWSIIDAKDGDVLISFSNHPFIYNGKFTETSVGGYCGLDVYGDFIVGEYIKDCNWTCNEDIKPATKEQRDLLFQKMKDAGYMWDAEKKELGKIEQKPAWSEEDDDDAWLNDIISKAECNLQLNKGEINWLKSRLKSIKPQSQQEWSDNDEKMLTTIVDYIISDNVLGSKYIDFLKSLRPQNTWKPSGEQMKALKWIIDGDNPENWSITLKNLYNDLKKLREE